MKSERGRTWTNKTDTDRILPKIRRRALKEPIEASPHPIRPYPPRRRQQTVRAKEIRWSRCALSLPEILPLNGSLGCGCGWWKMCWTGSDKRRKCCIIHGILLGLCACWWQDGTSKVDTKNHQKKCIHKSSNFAIAENLSSPSSDHEISIACLFAPFYSKRDFWLANT